MGRPRMQKIIAPDHLTISEFAKEKKVSRTVIYDHIEAGKIVPDLVGASQVQMIDYKVYNDYRFATPKWNTESIIANHESKKNS